LPHPLGSELLRSKNAGVQPLQLTGEMLIGARAVFGTEENPLHLWRLVDGILQQP